MKNIVFLAGILLSVTTLNLSAVAQFGLTTGIGVSDIAFLNEGQAPYLGYEVNSFEHRVPKFSYQLGAFYTLDLSKRFDLQPEVLFAMDGLNYSEKFIFDDIKYKINISYVKMPIVVRYKIFLKEKRQSGIFAGPYVAFKVNASLITQIDGNSKKKEISNVRNTDFGIAAGYFWDISLTKGGLAFSVKASYGLVNMMDLPDGYIPWYYEHQKEYARNISLMFTVGYRFNNLRLKKNTVE